jgi:hypothetical protein
MERIRGGAMLLRGLPLVWHWTWDRVVALRQSSKAGHSAGGRIQHGDARSQGLNKFENFHNYRIF